jgi:hypothetical protein
MAARSTNEVRSEMTCISGKTVQNHADRVVEKG